LIIAGEHVCRAYPQHTGCNKGVGSRGWGKLLLRHSSELPFLLFYSHIAPDVPLPLVVQRGRLISPFGFILDIYNYSIIG